jgi:branched-chain amino acid transport system permease protein
MDVVLTLAVGGLMVGALYGLVGVTVTAMYRTTGTLSFAHGGFALISAYMYTGLACGKTANERCTGEGTMSPWIIALLSILTAVVVAVLVERVVIRPLANSSSVNRMIATVAVLSLSAGICLQLNGPLAKALPDKAQVLPQGGFELAGVQIDWQRATIFALSILLVGVFVLVLRYTWLGLALRASGQAPDAARLMGVRPAQIARFNWAVAGLISGTAGVLVAPITVVNSGTFAFLMVKAIAACVIGGLVSMPLTFLGGLVIGLMEGLTPHWFGAAGSPQIAIALAVLGAVVVNQKRFAEQISRSPVSTARKVTRVEVVLALWMDAVRRLLGTMPRFVRLLPVLACVAFAMKDNYYAAIALNVLYIALVVLSLMAVSLSNQPSLMQAGIVGVGAFTLSTGLDRGLPFLGAVALGIGISAVVGLVAGLLSVRFRRLEFAIVTLVLGSVIADFALTKDSLKASILAPTTLGFDLLDSRNALVILGLGSLVFFVAVARLRKSTLGTSLRAAAEMDERVGHFAIDPHRPEIAAFALSGATAGYAGCIAALLLGTFNSFQFGPIVSLTLLLTAIVGGMGNLWGCLWAGLLFGYGPQLLSEASSDTANAYPAIVGSALALLLLIKAPGGLSGLFQWARETTAGLPVEDGKGQFRGYQVKLRQERAHDLRIGSWQEPAGAASRASAPTGAMQAELPVEGGGERMAPVRPRAAGPAYSYQAESRSVREGRRVVPIVGCGCSRHEFVLDGGGVAGVCS